MVLRIIHFRRRQLLKSKPKRLKETLRLELRKEVQLGIMYEADDGLHGLAGVTTR